MKKTSHGLQKALLSLALPLMVANGLTGLVTAQAADAPVALPDKTARAIDEPAYHQVEQTVKRDIPVQFLGINDLHGGLENYNKGFVGRMYQNLGGVSRLATYLNQSQDQFHRVNHSKNTFRVEAGDMVGAAPANSSLLAHESTMHTLRAMHFQIGTLGNHEFDRGLGEFNRILHGRRPGKDADALVKHYPHRATKMQEVVANVVRKSDGKQPYGYKPYTIKTVRAHGKSAKVGFIGIETTDLPHLTYPRNYQDYRVLDEAETIAKYDKILNKKGVKAVVVMAHTAVETWYGKTSGDAVNILNKVNQLDPENHVGLYLGAHSHQYANAKVNGKTHVVQSLAFAHAYSDSQGTINPKTGEFSSLTSHVYPVLSAKDDPNTLPDKKVEKIVQDANKRVAKTVNAVIGKTATTEPITQTTTRDGESGIGELVVDGQLFEARKQGLKADFAMTNDGGVRDSLKVNAQREITWGAASAVQPFGNVLQVIEMTGQQVVDTLNKQYDPKGGSLEIAGLHYTFTKQNGQNRVVQATKADGTPLDMQAKYNVIINDFLHTNGKYGFVGTPVVGSMASDTDVFVQYIKDMTAAGKTLAAPKPDRKQYVSASLATLPAAKPAQPAKAVVAAS